MGYQRFQEYQIGLPLFKVNELQKFQMLSYCVSTGETNSQCGLFCTVFHLYWCKMKMFGIFTAHLLWVKANKFDILEVFGMPLCQIWLIFSFCLEWKKNGLFWTMFLSELMQNEDIWNFHGSLSLSKWKLVWYSRSLWYAIVSNMTHFFHSVWDERKNGLFWTMGFICNDAKWRHLEFSWLTDFE